MPPIAAFFFSVTDPIIRLDSKRQKVWMWTYKGPIEMDWNRLVPRVEWSVATEYTTVRSYRGQYAELDAEGKVQKTGRFRHQFQVGHFSVDAEGVLTGMEYVRRYMEDGPLSINPPATYLSHRVRWHAMFNFMGLADDWVKWKQNKDRDGHPSVAPAPKWRTAYFVLLFPIFFPLQFCSWLAMAIARTPKWPKELEAMHRADLDAIAAEAAARRQADPLSDRAHEAQRPRRQPVIRVNGELVSGKPAEE